MSNTKTEAQRLADELAMHDDPRLYYEADELMARGASEIRRLDAIEQRYNEMMANPCPEWDNKAYMQAIANLRAQLAKAVAEEREACAKVCEYQADRFMQASPLEGNKPYASHECAAAIRARSNT